MGVKVPGSSLSFSQPGPLDLSCPLPHCALGRPLPFLGCDLHTGLKTETMGHHSPSAERSEEFSAGLHVVDSHTN